MAEYNYLINWVSNERTQRTGALTCENINKTSQKRVRNHLWWNAVITMLLTYLVGQELKVAATFASFGDGGQSTSQSGAASAIGVNSPWLQVSQSPNGAKHLRWIDIGSDLYKMQKLHLRPKPCMLRPDSWQLK